LRGEVGVSFCCTDLDRVVVSGDVTLVVLSPGSCKGEDCGLEVAVSWESSPPFCGVAATTGLKDDSKNSLRIEMY